MRIQAFEILTIATLFSKKSTMYIVPIAWLYVTLMMALAEANNPNGTVLGAIITFVLYGLMPIGLVVYVMGAPARKRANKAREQAELAAAQAAGAAYLRQAEVAQSPVAQTAGGTAAQASAVGSAAAPDAGGQAPADAVAAVRKEA